MLDEIKKMRILKLKNSEYLELVKNFYKRKKYIYSA